MWFTLWKTFSAVPIGLNHVNQYEHRRAKKHYDEMQRKDEQNFPWETKRKSKIWKKQSLSQIEWWEFHLWRNSPIFSTFFQHCQIINVTSLCKRLWTKCELWRSQYDRWGECVCTASLCVFSVPHDAKASRGWVTSYSLSETDGDAGVYISAVCVSVFANPFDHDIPTVFPECLQCDAHLSPFNIVPYSFA